MGKKTSKVSTVISGAISGATSGAIVQPLDVIRTRIQGDGGKGLIRGTFPTIRHIYQETGILGFWRGTTPTVLRMAIGSGLHFVLLEALKTVMHSNERNQTHAGKDALIGGLSRGGATIILCPFTVIKTRMEYVGRPYRSVPNAAVSIVRADGVAGLYRGVVPTFLSNAPFSALHFMFYRKMQALMYGDMENFTMTKNFVCSTTAAAVATLITQPFDVVRTQVQLGMGASGALQSAATLKRIFFHQGLKGMMLGVAPRIVKRTLQTGMIWTLYEEIAPRIRNAFPQKMH